MSFVPTIVVISSSSFLPPPPETKKHAPLGPVPPGHRGVLGRVRVGQHPEVAPLVRPAHQGGQLAPTALAAVAVFAAFAVAAGHRRRRERLCAADDAPGGPVQRQLVALAKLPAAEAGGSGALVDGELGDAADAGLAPGKEEVVLSFFNER